MPMPSALCAFEERYGRRIEYEHGEMLWFTRSVYRIKTLLRKMANGGKR